MEKYILLVAKYEYTKVRKGERKGETQWLVYIDIERNVPWDNTKLSQSESTLDVIQGTKRFSIITITIIISMCPGSIL